MEDFEDMLRLEVNISLWTESNFLLFDIEIQYLRLDLNANILQTVIRVMAIKFNVVLNSTFL